MSKQNIMLPINKHGRTNPFIIAISLYILALPCLVTANDKLTIASANFAPYFVQEDVVGDGYFDQLLLKTLNMKGYHHLKLVPLNNDAIQRYFNTKVADVAINYTALPPDGTFASRFRIKFVNRIIMHPSPWAEKITTLDDLTALKVASFIGASELFGDDYKNLMQHSGAHYNEIGNQHALNKQLHINKIDARIGDYLVFYWHTATHTPLNPEHFIYRDILDYQGSYILFQDKAVRDHFDEGFQWLIESGEVKTITKNWLQAYKLPAINHQFFPSQPSKAKTEVLINKN